MKRGNRAQEEKVFNRKTIHLYVITISLIAVFIVVGLIMLRYSVEGERNLPFEIKEINVISTASGIQQRDDYGYWYTELFKKNDIYFEIAKNPGHSREETISRIVFENFRIEKYNDTGNSIIYRQYEKGVYRYTEEFIIEDRLEYIGSMNTNIRELQINNQGGLIGFSVVIKEMGQYFFETNEAFVMDGTMLNRAGVSLEDITMTLYFDIIIEIGSGNRFRAEYRIDLPAGNILEEGMVHTEITDSSRVVFRRF
ncbi:MAG: hypothetical protein FWC68_03230 [Oscillospiraceae bacterium]|nr:hypothetical protein [Oscillospiraceae bacterium]